MAGPRGRTGKSGEKAENGDGIESTQDSALNSILKKLNGITNDANERAESMDHSLQLLSDKIDQFTTGLSDVKEEIKGLKSQSIGAKREARKHHNRIQELERKAELAERDAKRFNLVIEGLKEVNDQSLVDILDNLLIDLKVDFGVESCDRIYRRGKRLAPKDDRPLPPRPVIVTFLRQSYKAAVFKGLRNLTGIEKWSKVYLNDDYTNMQKIQINEMRAISALARSKGMDSKVRGNNLFVDGRRYGYGDVTRLPDGLSIEKAKTISVDEDKGIGFQSKHSFLSNMHECELVLDGFDFKSVEAAYQYERAKECGSRSDVRAVLEVDEPHHVKDVAKSITETPAWHKNKVHVMKNLLVKKFTENEDLKEKLINTGKKNLYELTYDRFWGCGIPITKANQVSSKDNPGANKLGKLLEEVRAELAKK